MKSRDGFAAVVFALGLSVAACVSVPDHAQAETFRVMTYNIHHGEGMDGRVDLTRIAALIKSAEADIVALQEVDKGVERTTRRDLPAELSALTDMTCVFSNNYHYQGGEYGNAVLTRFPVLHATNHLFQMIKAREQRGLLQLVLRVRDQEIAFWNTHLDAGHDDAERWAEITEIATLAASEPRPFLLCGDFNDIPTSRVSQKLAGQFDDVWAHVGKGTGCTVPVVQPNRRIDYFWAGKSRQFTPKSAWLIQSEASDHLPVVAAFEISSHKRRNDKP